MRLTIQHVYDFGTDRALVGDDLMRPEAWDALRTQTDGAFALPSDRTAWEATALGRPDILERATATAQRLHEIGPGSVVSYGVGGGTFEYALHRELPDVQLTLTEYAPATVERLQAVFPEVTTIRHDLLADAPMPGDVHVFHRIDTEFTNAVWRSLFGRFAGQRILFLCSEIITLRTGVHEVLYRLRNRNVTKAGWRRNEDAFRSLWRKTHEAERLQLGDLLAFDLRPRA